MDENCARCGAPFACGAGDPSKPCWCAGLPPVPPAIDSAGCLCPACLAAAAGVEAPVPKP